MASNLSLRIEQPEQSVPARVVQAVRAAILSGELPPGRRLTERELGDLTGVSRTSIREAIHHLQALGLVEQTSTRGIRVVVLGEADVRYIYELREALEAAAAMLFVENATDSEVEELAKLVPPVDAPSDERFDLVYKFDRLLIAGARNPLLRDTLEPLQERIHALRRLSTSIEGRSAESTREYEELVAAIRERSVERAAAASRKHVRAAAQAALQAARQLDS